MPDPLTPAEIQAIRVSHGYTQAQFAEVCGVNPRTARRWLSGETPLSGSALAIVRRLQADAERPASA